jgi:WD40 repeat protein
MFCNYCGASNPDGASFCSTCGKAVVHPPSKVSAPPQTSPNVPTPFSAVSPLSALLAAAEDPKLVGRSVAARTRDGLTGHTLTGHTGTICALAFSPDGHWLLSGSDDRTARLWDVVGGRELRTFTGAMGFASVDFSPDGRTLAFAATNDATPGTNSISLWEPVKPDEVRSLPGPEGQVFCIRFSPDGRLLASTDGATAHLSDVISGLVMTFKGSWLDSNSRGRGSTLAFSPDGRLLAKRSVGLRRLSLRPIGVTLIDLGGGQDVLTFGMESWSEPVPVFIGFTPDGHSVVVVGGDGKTKIWDVKSGKEVRHFAEPPKGEGLVEAAALSTDGNYLALAYGWSSDEANRCRVTLWSVPRACPVATVKMSDYSFCQAVAFSPDGEWLAIGDKEVKTTTDPLHPLSTGVIRLYQISELVESL